MCKQTFNAKHVDKHKHGANSSSPSCASKLFMLSTWINTNMGQIIYWSSSLLSSHFNPGYCYTCNREPLNIYFNTVKATYQLILVEIRELFSDSLLSQIVAGRNMRWATAHFHFLDVLELTNMSVNVHISVLKQRTFIITKIMES